jgi:pimeloyl-ACP methyl ester carboxylesterase
MKPVVTSEHYVDVPGGSVYVKFWTPHEALDPAPLILFHDSLGSVQSWRDFPARLAEELGRRVIAYDRLGFGRSTGRSDLPSIHFIREEAELVFPAMRDSLGLGRYVLFGHSVGGGMAVSCAGRFARDCQGVITEAAQAFVEPRTRAAIVQAKARLQDPAAFARLERYHADKATWVLRAWTELWLSSDFASWSLERELPRMRCPLLAIHGDRDEYGSVRFPEMLCELAGGPAQKLILRDCGHVPHRERPDLVLAEVARFLTSISLNEGAHSAQLV